MSKPIRNRQDLEAAKQGDFQLGEEEGRVRERPLPRKVADVYGMLHRPEGQDRIVMDADEELKRAMKRGKL